MDQHPLRQHKRKVVRYFCFWIKGTGFKGVKVRERTGDLLELNLN